MGFSQHRKQRYGLYGKRLASAVALGLGLGTLQAQYTGHSENKVKPGPVLRSIAVLEWTGEAGKPSASRLVPVAVFHDGLYEDGGLYLARPEPLALDGGTEYQLQQAGLPKGVFDVRSAQQMGGDWFGYGAWKPLPPPEAIHRLKPSKIAPEVIDGGDDRRPHFRKAPAAGSSAGPGGTGPVGANPPADPDRPTLSKRPQNAPDTSTSADPETAATSGQMETATAGGDPDRPHLTHGPSKTAPKEPEHLDGTPLGLEQMIAVSDAENRQEHSFRYSWSSPDDAAKMQAQLTAIAQQAIAKANPAAKPAVPRPAPHATTHATSTAPHKTTAAHRRTSHPAPAVSLTDVKFNAFELTYSGGATLVLTARTSGDEAKAQYVTIIAQPDIYGVPQVLFTQVTKADDLDATPRMRLVDAVDAAGDNRGDLLFELRGTTTREFAIYRVASGKIDQMIATGPLPIGKAVAD